jgi:hypothetical protein
MVYPVRCIKTKVIITDNFNSVIKREVELPTAPVRPAAPHAFLYFAKYEIELPGNVANWSVPIQHLD